MICRMFIEIGRFVVKSLYELEKYLSLSINVEEVDVKSKVNFGCVILSILSYKGEFKSALIFAIYFNEVAKCSVL